MSLFAIADLHLSFGSNKPMDVFSGWTNYVEKIKNNWIKQVKPTDTVVIAGDISWAMNLKEATADFEFINNLPGKKILLRGNHDYYFSTKRKIDLFFLNKNFNSLNFLFNNSFEYENFSICGTRGWVKMSDDEKFDKKILQREAGRLELSLKSAKLTPIVFLHYPPIFNKNQSTEILNVLFEYGIKKVFYGHLHGNACKFAIEGCLNGITYKLISSDYLNFKLFKIF